MKKSPIGTFDAHIFENINIRIKGKVHYTVVLTKLTDENRSSYQLKDIARKYEGHIVKFEYILDATRILTRLQITGCSLKLINNYANADVWKLLLSIHK